METLKIALDTELILSYPKPKGLNIFDTEANNNRIGIVLIQVQDGEERVIEYYKKILSKPEKNYCGVQKNLLAIIDVVGHFHKYLYGQHFKIRRNHAVLKWLLNLRNAEGHTAKLTSKLNIVRRSSIRTRLPYLEDPVGPMNALQALQSTRKIRRHQIGEEVETPRSMDNSETTVKNNDIALILESKENRDLRPQ